MPPMRIQRRLFLTFLVVGIVVTLSPYAAAQSECTKSGGCSAQFSDVFDFSSGVCLDEATHRYQLWGFDVYSGTRVIVDISTATFTPALDLIDPTNHGFATGTNRIDIATNAAGRWTIRVRNIVVGAGGPYTLKFTCQGGSAPPPPVTPPEPETAFRVGPVPTELTLQPGSTATVKVYVAPILPFASEIKVIGSGAPPGASLIPAEFTVAAPGTGVQDVAGVASGGAQGGSYPITFTGTSTDGTRRRGGVRLLIDAPCLPPMLIGSLPAASVVAGGSATLTVSPGGTPPFLFSWFRGFTGSTFAPQSATTKGTFVTPPLQNPGQFWVLIANECGSTDSGTMFVKVLDAPSRRRSVSH